MCFTHHALEPPDRLSNPAKHLYSVISEIRHNYTTVSSNAQTMRIIQLSIPVTFPTKFMQEFSITTKYLYSMIVSIRNNYMSFSAHRNPGWTKEFAIQTSLLAKIEQKLTTRIENLVEGKT
jgi:hypothetical protein